jgi:hypothetical protein
VVWWEQRGSGISYSDKIPTTDLSQEVTRLELPVYFLEGVYDYTCSQPNLRGTGKIFEDFAGGCVERSK